MSWKRNSIALLLIVTMRDSVPIPSQTQKAGDAIYKTNTILEVKHSTSDFVPDANLNKKTWKQANWVEFDHSMDGKASLPAEKSRVAAVWTEKYVYFAFWCKYERLNTFEGEDPAKERWELWNKDVAEIFLNPQPERLWHYYEFEVAPDNQWIDLEITGKGIEAHDAKWNSGFEHATHIDSENHIWTTEMRIPLSSMNASEPKVGMEWRANFYRASGLGSDEQRKFLAWSVISEGTTFHAPNYFGILRLAK